MKKITRRSFLAAAGVSAAALALTACGGSSNSAASTSTAASSTAASAAGDAAAAANDPKVTLVYAEVNPLDTIVGQTATHFKEKVEELTGGSVVIDVQASGVLGSENDVLDAILGGSTSIDMSRISAFAHDQLWLQQVQAAVHPLHLREPRTLLELRQQRSGT